MPLYKFQQNDIFHNRLEVHPQCNFFIYSGSVYYNNRPAFHGAFTSVKAQATLVCDKSPIQEEGIVDADSLDNSTVTLIDFSRNEVTYKFDKDLTTVDGSKDSDGNVIVGISGATTPLLVVTRLKQAINATTPAASGYNLYITAETSDSTAELILESEQDTPSNTANTAITITNPNENPRSFISGPEKFSGGSSANDPGGITADGVPAGHVSLYGLNLDRVSGSSTLGQRDTGASTSIPMSKAPDIIYPFIIKDSTMLTDFKEVRISRPAGGEGVPVNLIDTLPVGSVITGSYSKSASISKEYFIPNHVFEASSDLTDAINEEKVTPNTIEYGLSIKSSMGSKISALQNTLDSYIGLSHHYAYSSASLAVTTGQVVNWSKAEQEMGLISIPSIFYDSSIQKGTVNLKFYVTGTLVGELKDEKSNGELIQIGPSGSYESGSIAGVVMYNEGFILLTGSWDLTKAGYVSGPAHTENYVGPKASSPRWIDFAQTIATGSLHMPNSSFELDFKGTSYVPVMTMLAHARKGHLNHSNNPTYVKYGQTTTAITSPRKFRENPELEIKNTVSSSYHDFTASFERQTYISKIGIYDKKRNLIGIAKVATPVKKTEDREFTFKLKLDF